MTTCSIHRSMRCSPFSARKHKWTSSSSSSSSSSRLHEQHLSSSPVHRSRIAFSTNSLCRSHFSSRTSSSFHNQTHVLCKKALFSTSSSSSSSFSTSSSSSSTSSSSGSQPQQQTASSSSSPSSASSSSVIRVLRLHVPILEQLQIEEALLRTSNDNFLILNSHRGMPQIILGISGQPELWISLPHVMHDHVLCIKRFTGGGTVYVDENTLFTTFIMSTHALPDIKPYPKAILQWVFERWQPVFEETNTGSINNEADDALKLNETKRDATGNKKITENDAVDAEARIQEEDGSIASNESSLLLNANDFCFGQRKVAGNAQSITRNRWLHHTSWLWKSDVQLMSRYLVQPPLTRLPAYRQHRKHDAFVSSLSESWKQVHLASTTPVQARDALNLISFPMMRQMEQQGWILAEESIETILPLLQLKHDRVTAVLDLEKEIERKARQLAQVAQMTQINNHAL